MKREKDHAWNTSFSLFGLVTPHAQPSQQTTTRIADQGQSASKVPLGYRDWYISVGVPSISPTFPRVPFHSNILSNASLTSPSPAVLVQRYSSTPECWFSRSSILKLCICLSLSYHHPFHYFSVLSSFLATCLPWTLVISSLFPFRSFQLQTNHM